MQESPAHISLTTGERISLWAGRVGLKQKDLSARVGVSAKQMGRYVSGQISPPGKTLARIADELGVSTDYLLCRTENPQTRVKCDGQVPRLLRSVPTSDPPVHATTHVQPPLVRGVSPSTDRTTQA